MGDIQQGRKFELSRSEKEAFSPFHPKHDERILRRSMNLTSKVSLEMHAKKVGAMEDAARQCVMEIWPHFKFGLLSSKLLNQNVL